MFKLALSAGHGLYTAGKRCLKSLDQNETREWSLNSRVCDKIEEKLKSYSGYELLRLDDPTGKNDISLKTRTDKANAFNADFYLSIHHNAGIAGGSGGGTIAFVYLQSKEGSPEQQWQKALYDEIIKTTGLKGNRAEPLAKADFHELRESKMPAVLIECGFMDSKVDTPIILTDSFADKVASACVKVIAERAGLKLSSQESPPTLSPAQKSVQELANEVIAGRWGNGEERKSRLLSAGYDYAAVQGEVNKILSEQDDKAFFPKYEGDTDSIVDALKALGEDGSYSHREKIAKANGITAYSGTAKQNLLMLSLLKAGKLKKI